MPRKILITGNMGYIGPTLVKHLTASSHDDYEITGFDNGYFAHCLTSLDSFPERALKAQYFGDLRDFDGDILNGIDTVIHLAAISNDPIGNVFADVTKSINIDASVQVAQAAKKAGVRRFVFASSCSVYGAGSDKPCDENAPLNPLTPYAISKIAMEDALEDLCDDTFSAVCLRFATACGMSDRLRLDLVLNDFVASVISTGKIEILSDGTPWRPLIHVKDMSRALEWGALTDHAKPFLVLNSGSSIWNYQIKDLAQAVASAIPDSAVSLNQNAMPDKRSYQVDFSSFTELAAGFTPVVTLEEAIEGLRSGLNRIGFNDPDFREHNLMRLRMLRSHQDHGVLNEDLRWIA